MSIYAATFFFESMQEADIGVGSSLGWSETWYKQSNDPVDAVITDPELMKYINLRIAMMPDIYRISFLRVSDTEHNRRFKVANVPGGRGLIHSDGTFGPAQVQCAILVDLERLPAGAIPSEKVHHRRFLIRGLSSGIINGNVLQPFAVGWVDVKAFLEYIGNHATGTPKPNPRVGWSWGVRYINPANVETAILRLSPAPWDDHQVLINPDVDPAAVRGEKYLVKGVDSPPGMNRVWTFNGRFDDAGAKKAIFGTTRKKIQGEYGGPGRGVYVKASYLAGPVDQYVIIGLRNKRTGRVFRQLRGSSAQG